MDPVRAEALVAELTGSTVGGWTVRGLLGSGKSAVVFEAARGSDTAALKIFDRELVERFGRDVQQRRLERELSLRGLAHPNLVGIIDGGFDAPSRSMFIVMELVRAKTLSDVLDKVPRERIWTLISQVARAAQFLEERELCHRDIKPDNIAVSPDYEHATLLDLGVLKPFGSASQDPITDEQELVFIGTLQYASPEFMNRIEEDDRDGWRSLTIYQLGTVLHDLIMQRRIFSNAKPYARMVSAVGSEIPHIEAADVPADLVLLAKNCLLKDPAHRTKYVSWASFEPPSSNADTTARTTERIRRRNNLGGGQRLPGEWRTRRDDAQALRGVLLVVDNLVRDSCAKLDFLPPAIFGQSSSQASSEGLVTVRFDKSERHHLNAQLLFYFRVKLVDTPASVVQIDGFAVLSESAFDPDEHATRFVPLFEGALERRSLGEQISSTLISAFDLAQDSGTNGTFRWVWSNDPGMTA